jgi:hypothetical protein
MPGPKMGPRPTDFDEQLIRQSPTFLRWAQMDMGGKAEAWLRVLMFERFYF